MTVGTRKKALAGERWEIARGEAGYPQAFDVLERPPERLYVVGNPAAMREGLAVVGARKATPYGKSCAKRFAGLAASRGIAIISGGARGCDTVAHEAALAAGAPTVVFLGGGCDELYPSENAGLFQRVVDAGGAVVSEHPWGFKPLPFAFRERNRLIASLAKATLIVEAGLPSGTFSTADEALAANREVLVVPGAVTSPASHGANRLIYQGATPVIDDESFGDILFGLFGCLKQEVVREGTPGDAVGLDAGGPRERAVLEALRAEPLGLEALRGIVLRADAAVQGGSGGDGDAQRACAGVPQRGDGARSAEGIPREAGLGGSGAPQRGGDALTWLMVWLASAQRDGIVAQYPDGKYGPCLKAG